MTLKKHTIIRIATGLVFLTSLIVVVLFIPPINILIVGLMILLTALSVYFLALIITKKSYALLAAIGVLTFLIVSYIAGFNFLNTILLLSFIIGIGILLKKE